MIKISKVWSVDHQSLHIITSEPVQCFAGYFDIEYGHLLDGEKQKGVIINTCKEFNLLPLTKGYLPIRATPPCRLGINT